MTYPQSTFTHNPGMTAKYVKIPSIEILLFNRLDKPCVLLQFFKSPTPTLTAFTNGSPMLMDQVQVSWNWASLDLHESRFLQTLLTMQYFCDVFNV